jgi:hypothetical protein
MRLLLTILILALIVWVGTKLYSSWEDVRRKQHEADRGEVVNPPASQAAPDALPGMAPVLEPSLEAARKLGADGLKAWLKQNRRFVQDPRLAAIELDYVVMAGGNNFNEARQVFADVKSRTPTNSPVYPRIRKLARSYE